MWYLTGSKNETYVTSKDAFSKQELDSVNQIYDDIQLQDGIAVESTGQMRKSKIGWVDSYDTNLEWLYRKLTDLTIEVNNAFFNYDLVSLEPLQLTEYSESYQGEYKKHVDYGYDTLVNRKLSFSVQLSDSLEYEGGNLILHSGDDPIHISREKGLVVFFPSYVLHEVTQVTKGTRRSLVGWVSGPRFK